MDTDFKLDTDPGIDFSAVDTLTADQQDSEDGMNNDTPDSFSSFTEALENAVDRLSSGGLLSCDYDIDYSVAAGLESDNFTPDEAARYFLGLEPYVKAADEYLKVHYGHTVDEAGLSTAILEAAQAQGKPAASFAKTWADFHAIPALPQAGPSLDDSAALDPHPWYSGGCDALAPKGECAECSKSAPPQVHRLKDKLGR